MERDPGRDGRIGRIIRCPQHANAKRGSNAWTRKAAHPYGESVMARVAAPASQTEAVLGALHDISNSITSLGGVARTLVDSGDRMDAPLRDELGALVLRQAGQLRWLVDAMREICDPGRRASDGSIDTASLVRSAAGIAGAAVRLDGTAVFSGDFERIRLGLEALFDAVARIDAVISLDESGRILIVRSGPVDLSFGGVRWRLALARRLLQEQGVTLTIECDDEVTRAVVEFPETNVIRV